MPSFDIVCKVDAQMLDNAVNVAYKEITNRFDFRDSETTIELNKKDMIVTIETENDMRLRAVEDMLMTRAIKQGIDGRSFDFTKEAQASGKILKKTIKIKAGLEKEDSKKIVKIIKDSKIKVDASIMDDQVRVVSKKIDDLQAIIQLLRTSETGIPMQFINMKG